MMSGDLTLDTVMAVMRRIKDDTALLMPWVAWARKNPVQLHLSAYAPASGPVYVLQPPAVEHYTVVAHPLAFRACRRAFDADSGPFPMSDKAVAEMIAWHELKSRQLPPLVP